MRRGVLRTLHHPFIIDYWPVDVAPEPHGFDETIRDCVFAGDVLVLVGEVFGKHTLGEEPKHDRRILLEYDAVAMGPPTWTVGGAGPGFQSRALAVDVDDQGRYLIAGYTCGYACEPDGEVRVHLPGGKFQWQAPIYAGGVGAGKYPAIAYIPG